MKTNVRAVQVWADTSIGPAGRTIFFKPGLNVIRGDNSRGKTQALQAIIYALGLEAMFGPGSSSRMGSAFTQELLLPDANAETGEISANIVSSWCAVELQNEDGQVLTAQRWVKSPSIVSNLVRTWTSGVLTDGAAPAVESDDYFVRLAGSAQRERGFHSRLAKFLHWDLPQVSRYTGGETQLYLELLFPFLYVDQRSWGSAGPRLVSQFQVREPTRKAVEFLLAFDGPRAEAQRNGLESEIVQLRNEWKSMRDTALATAQFSGARLIGVPDLPAGARAGARSQVSPTDLSEAGVEVLHGDEWRPVEDEANELATSLSAAELGEDASAPIVGDFETEDLTARLIAAQEELSDNVATAQAIEQQLILSEAQAAALDRRIAALQEERSRNQDVRTLVRLGSQHADQHIADQDCPTCHQSLLTVEAEELGPILNVDDTINLLNSQISTMKSMRERTTGSTDQLRSTFAAVQRASDAIRTQIRALQADLVAPANYPSSSQIAQRIGVENRLRELERTLEISAEWIDKLQAVATRIATIRSSLISLPAGVTAEDERRLGEVIRLMREQLKEFGFSSYQTKNVGLDSDTLRPERSGFDIDSDVSSTDVVRTKIAYLNGIRELAHSLDSPHPGLLILDEPRQHELDEEHFRTTLARLANSSTQGDQIIVTSAAAAELLREVVGDDNAFVIDLGAIRLLQRDPAGGAIDPSAHINPPGPGTGQGGNQ